MRVGSRQTAVFSILAARLTYWDGEEAGSGTSNSITWVSVYLRQHHMGLHVLQTASYGSAYIILQTASHGSACTSDSTAWVCINFRQHHMSLHVLQTASHGSAYIILQTASHESSCTSDSITWVCIYYTSDSIT